jgi:hypothetical protein
MLDSAISAAMVNPALPQMSGAAGRTTTVCTL